MSLYLPFGTIPRMAYKIVISAGSATDELIAADKNGTPYSSIFSAPYYYDSFCGKF